MGWNQLTVNAPDINTRALTGILDNVKSAIETLTNILETILQFVPSTTDPLALLLKALIDQLRTTVESFLEDYGAYTLFVPVGKRLQTNFLGLGDITPSWAGQLGIFGSDASPVDPKDSDLNEFLVTSNRYNGGNAGFFKTVVSSLYDEGDVNRPTFLEEEDYVGGMVLLMGTDADPLGLLDDMWTLNGMFSGPDTTPKVPRPKNLKVRTIEGVSNGVFTSMLTWDPPETPVWTLPDLGGTVLVPTRYAIIRGKNTTRALTAVNIVDLMGKRDLHTGDTFSNDQVEIIYEGPYDISKSSYVDLDVSTDPEDAFYYTVAWKLTAYGASEPITENTGKNLEYWNISNTFRVTPYPTLPASTPPDWRRTSSVADLFPPLASLLRKLVVQIESFTAKLTSPADAVSNYIDFLKSEILRYEANIRGITDDVTRLQALFKLPSAGVFSRTFKGKGGNDFFITDLAASFLPGYPGRPAFTRGNEYVTGVVILAGGPQPAVEGLIRGLEWVFGTSSENEQQTETLTQLDRALEEVEERFFGENMQEQNTQPTEKPETTFNLAMNPLSKQEETVEPAVFGPNMETI